MGLFNKKSTKNKGYVNNGTPDIQFGRYTDRHKTKEQLDAWDRCVKNYNEGKYLDAYYDFFNYLRDPKVENVKFEKSFDKITFEIIQGSKIVTGYASEKEVVAEAEVASFENKAHVAVMRKLLSVNYDLFFSKFALKDNIFTIKYSASVKDASPLPLYYSLKEVANTSDKYDDVLTEEFSFLKPVNVSHIIELPEKEKEIKYNFFKKFTENTLKEANSLSEKDLAGGGAFLLLSLTFKLYYLLAPEGVFLDDLRYIQGIFFRNDNKETAEKNYLIIKEYEKLLNKPKEEILKSFYKTKATFAVVKPTNFSEVYKFILDEIKKSDWYRNNGYFNVEQAIYDYIVAYAEFWFGMDKPAYEFLEIYWQVTNDKYYKELGFKADYYNSENKTFNKIAVENEIQRIKTKYKPDYPNINFISKNIKYNNLQDFSFSFLNELTYLNLSK